MATPNPMDALKRLLRMQSSQNYSDMSAAPTSALDEMADPRLSEFQPSELDLQEEQTARTQRTPSGSFTQPSRDQVRESAMSKVKSLLGMQDIKQKQALEAEAQKQAGLTQRAEIAATKEAQSRPYFTPLQTGEGIQSFDTRTGKVVGRLGDYKPGESAQEVLTTAQSVKSDIDRVRNFFRPEFVGPLAGRYGTVEQALLGGNPEMTNMYQTAQRLHNTIVYLRTGKQMNESEAARIEAELPNKNNKPDVFIQKLNNVANYFDEWLTNRSKLAFGRTTAEDVNRLTGTGGPVTPSAGTPTPSGVRRYNPATKRIE